MPFGLVAGMYRGRNERLASLSLPRFQPATYRPLPTGPTRPLAVFHADGFRSPTGARISAREHRQGKVVREMRFAERDRHPTSHCNKKYRGAHIVLN